MTEALPKHSPLGASGAERWMSCPGSVSLIKSLGMAESDEEDFQKEGTALHAVTAHCLQNDCDAWELAGETIEDVTIDVPMSNAVQLALDTARPLIVPHGKTYIEHRISSSIHPSYYGTVDFAVVADSLLNVVDFKFGQGVIVEPDNNPQIMYYAYGILQHYPEVRRVVLRIVQPRAFHQDGPVRRWETTAEAIHEWVAMELVPAMDRTEGSKDLSPGDWCRFCPAKLVCPVLSGLFERAATYDPTEVVKATDAILGQNYRLTKAVKNYITALEKEVLRRLQTGIEVPGTKLVHKRANRVWRPGADAVMRNHFGDAAMVPAEVKSPAEIEKLGGKAKDFVSEFAYTPESGLTVALEDDNRVAVKLPKASEVFAGILEGVG